MSLLLSLLLIFATNRGPNLMCSEIPVVLPQYVTIEQGIDPAPWIAAMAEWNQRRTNTFVLSENGNVRIRREGPQTWVNYCGSPRNPVIYVAGEVDYRYWAAHELAHTLGWADHLRVGDSRQGYANPGSCPEDNYWGIVSYCSPRSEWWSPGDIAALWAIPHRDTMNYKIFIGGL